MKHLKRSRILPKMPAAFALVFLLSSALCSYAFDWPQDAVLSDSFYSYFGQRRGNAVSSSLIFSEYSEVKAAGDGKIAVIILEHDGDMGWFDSSLGNAVIINHDDKLMTVYGNLDGEEFAIDPGNVTEAAAGMLLGASGNSGWQQGKSCLEFQVIDLEQNAAVNPRLLMPHIGKELELFVGNISAVNKSGNNFAIRSQMAIPAGQYSFYRTRQKTTIPYKTSVFINGAVVEKISYDLLKQDDMRLCVLGNRPYSSEEIYPDNDKQLLSVLTLSSGRNILTVSVADIHGNEKTADYVLFVK
ncbi:M23 family metallopeptidase [Treponema parvum]|uniref:M23 family metallopeptidase n=1 Tax=Treponema parvum TaxID=138851 RepID=A0A975ICA3_9SPIR|nr:M23 family metallopeptidase [Treponema parvum]QTQ11503.1 M23 family metallopeptidase [Treponema parvum]